jgi:ATP-dependent Clp protease ATP-binding subunit ClpC
MYPFERFSEAAKVTLTLAQEEAERAHHRYIGAEHLLLGLVKQRGTLAGEALSRLGLTYESTCQKIDAVLGHNEPVPLHQITPTSRVKKVVELSFDRARLMGSARVCTDHLLIGVMLEGMGVAAHVLGEAGVTVQRVVDTTAALRDEGIAEELS